MLTAIVYAIVYVLVGFLLTYLVSAYLPVDAHIKQIVNIIIWILVILQAVRLVLGSIGGPVL